MTVIIEIETEAPFDFDCQKLAEEVIVFSLSHENFPYEAEVNLTLTDNDAIQEINREYRQMDKPTDVLSFPMLNLETAGDFSNIEDDRSEERRVGKEC